MKLIQLKQKDIKPLKEKLWLQNNKQCPLLKQEVPLDKMVLDHIHKLNSQEPTPQLGTIRNAIEFRANSIEGKITNAWKRYYGQNEPLPLPEFLRNLADYLEAGSYSDNSTYYVHPTEVQRAPKLSKRNYNKLKKAYIGKRMLPIFPKSGKLTKPLQLLYTEYNIEPYN